MFGTVAQMVEHQVEALGVEASKASGATHITEAGLSS